jgi:hypothetical protein
MTNTRGASRFLDKGIYEKLRSDLVDDEALQERLLKISEGFVGEEFRVDQRRQARTRGEDEVFGFRIS